MIFTALSYLVVNPLGRKLALIGLATAGAAILCWRIYAAGKDHEKTQQLEATLNAVRERVKTDEEVSRLSPAERRERLSKWVRG